MHGYVGVTDDDWYRFLAVRPEISEAEVNFWRPGGGRGFHALTVGEPFFFKTHSPHNRIVGGGFYSGFAALRVSEAWQLFGLANGVDSLERMRARIEYYRRTSIAPGEDPVIGCVFVRNVTFFPESAAFQPPPDFAASRRPDDGIQLPAGEDFLAEDGDGGLAYLGGYGHGVVDVVG